MKEMENKDLKENEYKDPIGDLRRSLNEPLPEREQFHKWYNQVKNLPEFFELAKQRSKKWQQQN